MVDILMGKNLWRIVNGDIQNPIDAKELVVGEEHCKQTRGLL